jgi:hypothetical protein
MRENIINVFGRWIDLSRIISLSNPKLGDSCSQGTFISFNIYAEMLDKPILIKQTIFKGLDIWTKSPASLFVGKEITSQCPIIATDSTTACASVAILDYVIGQIGDAEKVLRNLKSLQKFWQDYDLLLQKWKECQQ